MYAHGQFIRNKLDGKGKIVKKSGTIEEGTFKSYSLNGQGYRIRPDGTEEVGNFTYGLF